MAAARQKKFGRLYVLVIMRWMNRLQLVVDGQGVLDVPVRASDDGKQLVKRAYKAWSSLPSSAAARG
jgi:hypothetical protein